MALTKADKQFIIEVIDKKLSEVKLDINELKYRLDKIEQKVNTIDLRIIKLVLKIDKVERNLKSSIDALKIYMDTSLAGVDKKYRRID